MHFTSSNEWACRPVASSGPLGPGASATRLFMRLTSITSASSGWGARDARGWGGFSLEACLRGCCASPIYRSLSFEGRTETIAAARGRLGHLGARGVMLELEPQSLDEDAQVVALVAVGGPPHLVEQRAIVHDLVGMAGQLGHQQVLSRR